MLETLLREAMAASTRDKAKASDYGDPEGKKFPIMSQASVMAAARLLGRAKGYDDAKKAAVKARIIRIAKRKGFSLPKSWATKKEAIADLSGEMLSCAIQAALMEETDPDMDGDDDSEDWMNQPRVRHVFANATPPYFIFQMGWDGDWFRRDFSLDANDEAVLGDAVSEVRPVLSFVGVTDTEDEVQEAFEVVINDQHAQETGTLATEKVITESNRGGAHFREVFESSSFREATVGDDEMFHITGTAINPGVNRSGTRVYPKETLAKALPLFKGAKMYIDHPSLMDEKIRPERSIKDIGGRIEEAWINGKGGIDYRAVVIDPALREKLSLMNKAGALDAMGTSVNYMGTSSPVVHEGVNLDNIDDFTKLHSLDFVTEAGAWGDIARMESAGAVGAPQSKERDDDVTNEELQKLVEGMAATVTTLGTTVTGLADRQAKNEARAEIRAMVTAAELPKESADIILEQFKDAVSTDGVEAIIKQHTALVESLRPKAAAKVAAKPKAEVRKVERVVVGMGDTGGDDEGDEDEHLEAPNRETFAKDMARMFGGEDKAAAFFERFGG